MCTTEYIAHKIGRDPWKGTIDWVVDLDCATHPSAQIEGLLPYPLSFWLYSKHLMMQVLCPSSATKKKSAAAVVILWRYPRNSRAFTLGAD